MNQQKPIVYSYEEEIVELYSIFSNRKNSEMLHKGVAFEWKGESVFHTHTKFPNSTILGIPIVSLFVFFSDEISSEQEHERINEIANQYLNNNNEFSKNIIICTFRMTDNKLNKNAYLNNENGIIECSLLYVPKKSELYSRSKGLLEVDVLEKKKVSIIGLGSFGSYVAIELAKAGVGNFYLYDFDRIELANIARHSCGVSELGRYKTHAIRDSILQKNPFANIVTHEININEHYDLFKSEINETDLIICLTDENQSRNMINELALEQKKITLFGRAVTRAEGGDVFRLRPDDSNAPCLACIIGKGLFSFANEEVSNIRQAKRDLPAYMSEEDRNATIQVGLSSDIAPICNMIIKLALVELSRGIESGISSFEEDLVADYYIWANRREKHYKKWDAMGFTANKISILRWYGVRTKKDENCLVCNL